jgi:chemotaxis protein histidine kinase CheA
MQPEQYKQLINLFIEESQENLQIIESGILNLSEIIQNYQKVQELFLAAHSIKGGAAFLGLKSIQKLALGIEKCFRVLKEHPVQADHKLISLLFRGFEFLQVLFQELATPEGLTETKASEVIRKSESIFEELHLYLDILVIEAEPEPETPAEDEENLEKLMEEAAEIPHQSHGLPHLPKHPSLNPKIRVSAKLLDHLSNLVAELMIKSNKIAEENVKQEQLVKRLSQGLQFLQVQPSKTQETKSIFEDLTTIVKDWTSSFQEIQQLNYQIIEIKSQLNEELSQIRTIPFFKIAERWHQTLQENAIRVNKSIEFVVEGRDILVDRLMMEQLYEPVNYLLERALGSPLECGIRWGIETSDIRQSLGKPSRGQIGIGAFYQSNRLVITISDDGAGIDPEDVKKIAIQRKMITPERLQNLSGQNVYDLLFFPQFSLYTLNSHLSVKTLSLNWFRQVVKELRGSIQVDSKLGKGTTFTIYIPRIVNITTILPCIYQGVEIAFLYDEVVETLTIPATFIQINEHEQNYLVWRELKLPIYDLNELFKSTGLFPESSPAMQSEQLDVLMMILCYESNFLAIRVDQILSRQEVAVKQPNDPIYKTPGIAGISVVKEAQILPILDAGELMDLAVKRLR